MILMPRPDLEDWYVRQFEKGKSVQEAVSEAAKAGWDDYDTWRDWALEGALTKFHRKHGISKEMRRNEFLYMVMMVLVTVFVMVYFSKPRG